jgi:hypothetical protein
MNTGENARMEGVEPSGGVQTHAAEAGGGDDDAPSAIASSEIDNGGLSASEEDEGTLGEITKWVFTAADSRFQTIVKQAVTERFKKVISGVEACTAFCCGGQIPISSSGDPNNKNVSPPWSYDSTHPMEMSLRLSSTVTNPPRPML